MNSNSWAINKKAFHDYAILETFEAGICLSGTETKSIRSGGKVQFADSHIRIIQNQVYLVNCFISQYSHGTHSNHEETRTRKLLLHKKEILKLSQKADEKGLTLIPLKFYAKKHLIKVEVALAKGKKTFEKREDLKKESLKKELAKSFKSSQFKL